MIRIACDLDNVVVDILHSAKMAMAGFVGVPIEEITMSWIYQAPFSHPDPTIAERLVPSNAFWQLEEVVGKAKPLQGAIEALNELHRHGMLAGYVTRRAPEAGVATRQWLRSFGAPDVPLHMVGHVEAERCYESCKSEACFALGATHLIDDNPHEAGRAIEAGLNVVVVDHPLGRPVREEWVARNQGVTVARDVAHAADLLIRSNGIY